MIAVIADALQQKELAGYGITEDQPIIWLTAPATHNAATVYIDLRYDGSKERIELLRQLPAECIIINDVAGSLRDLPANFARFNGWPGFLQQAAVECAVANEILKPVVEETFAIFSRKVVFTPDTPGFISARIIAMIINEAYLAAAEGVSIKPETDTAMKMGTNYPYGPFEWAEKIGLQNLHALLVAMADTNKRYTPAPMLTHEATTT